jgi:phenylalanyl-tRNA synthetase alpha chain
MLEQLEVLLNEANAEIASAGNVEALEAVKVKYLGRKAPLNNLLKDLGTISPDKRPLVGKRVNEIKTLLETAINEKNKVFQSKLFEKKLDMEKLDVTLPGIKTKTGKLHPLTLVLEEVKEVFLRLGYSIADGPEIETDYYNFEALNIPADHPSRDMHDTFYIMQGLLLRTHTSPGQIRVLEKTKPPFAIIIPGRVYRCDADSTHSPVFHQCEGLVMDEKITFASLKGTLEAFLHAFFGRERKVRFRPSYFPFTEPSAEVDVECGTCQGAGELEGQKCRVCSGTGWLEILGAGIVDPNVTKFRGFAFGVGIERLAMLKYGIDDIRLFFENDLRFLEQF